MGESIGLAVPPNVKAVDAMEQDGEPKGGGLNDDPPRYGLEGVGNLVVTADAHQGITIGPEMLEKEGSDGYHAAKGLKLVEDVTGFGFSR
jgi:hypothetical protein